MVPDPMEALMQFTRILFTLFVLGTVLTAKDLVLRALPVDSPIRIDNVEKVQLLVDADRIPFLRVEGRNCVGIEEANFCDFIEFDYEFPQGLLEVRETGERSLEVVVASRKYKYQTIATLNMPEREAVVANIAQKTVLFYDEQNEVPAILLMGTKDYPFRLQVQKSKFDQLHSDLI